MAAARELPRNIPDMGEEDSSIGMPKTIRIILEENDGIPPTGQYFGANGRGYMLRPGEEADVPLEIVDILNHCIMATAVVDPQTLRVLRMRNRLRFPYRIIRDNARDLRP